MDGNEAGVDLALIQPFLLSFNKHFVSIISITKQRRFVSKHCYALRCNRRFIVPKCKTDRFRNSFIIRSCTSIFRLFITFFTLLYLRLLVLYTHFINCIICKYAIQSLCSKVLLINYPTIYLSWSTSVLHSLRV